MNDQLLQEALSLGGTSAELLFADGHSLRGTSEGTQVRANPSGAVFAHPAPSARLAEPLAQGSLRPLLSLFANTPLLDALSLEDTNSACRLRVVRQPATLPPKLSLRWTQGNTAEQGAEVYLPISGAAPAVPLSAVEALRALRQLEQPLWIGLHEGQPRLFAQELSPEQSLGRVPAVRREDLGSPGFRRAFGLRYAYATGAMAGGIGSVELAAALGKVGGMGFFGAGGVPLGKVEEAILALQRALPEGQSFGMNLLHNPFEPKIEEETVALYLKHGVRCIDAAAYMNLTPWVVWFRAKGMRRAPDGAVIVPNRVLAKVSRAEVAAHFFQPPPEKMLRELVAAGKLSEDEARLAQTLPVADAITAEADSGGHTDRRPLSVLVPLMLRARAQAAEKHHYATQKIEVFIGAAGGVGEPLSARAALALGADYLLTGSLNQATVEADTSPLVKKMLAEADMADVGMAPAPDMFELGAQVQVLKRGTLYPSRAQKLYEVYKAHERFEDIPAEEREKIEKQAFRRPYAEVWRDTAQYWQARDPKVYADAQQNPRLQMALSFRWYLGMSSRWARLGDEARKLDFQVWCGPAIGAFNRWVKGSRLDALDARRAADIALELLRGTAALTRLDVARAFGVRELPAPEQVAAVE
jgi:PfaD family protein